MAKLKGTKPLSPAKGKGKPKYKPGQIVPSDPTKWIRVEQLKKKPLKPGEVPKTDPGDIINPVPLTNPCAGTIGGRMAFTVCYDGQPVLANDYPADGGPWMPAFTAQGSLVWVNAGGL